MCGGLAAAAVFAGVAAALAMANYLLDCNKFINVYVLVGWLVGCLPWPIRAFRLVVRG